MVLCLILLIPAVVLLSILDNQRAGIIMFVVAAIPLATGVIMAMCGIRCPRCNGNLQCLLQIASKRSGVSGTATVCPFCGVNLDEEAKTEEPTSKSTLSP
jgi:hypothetical protein